MAPVFEVAIGLIFVYLMLSLIASAVNEGIASLLTWRAWFLKRGIQSLLGKPMAERLYEHGLIRQLKRKRRVLPRNPSYISSGTFATAFLDVLSRVRPAQSDTARHEHSGTHDVDPSTVPAEEPEMAALRDRVDVLPRAQGKHESEAIELGEVESRDRADIADLHEGLRSLFNTTATVAEARAAVERWFNEAMDRVSGWYSRWTRVAIFAIGAVLVSVLNADSISITSALWKNPTLREAAVNAAQDVTASPTPAPTPSAGTTPAPAPSRGSAAPPGGPAVSPSEALRSLDRLAQLELPLGWVQKKAQQSDAVYLADPRHIPRGAGDWTLKVVGLLLTAIGITFGAPFWFDLLKKIVGLRGSGPPPPPPGPEASATRASAPSR